MLETLLAALATAIGKAVLAYLEAKQAETVATNKAVQDAADTTAADTTAVSDAQAANNAVARDRDAIIDRLRKATSSPTSGPGGNAS